MLWVTSFRSWRWDLRNKGTETQSISATSGQNLQELVTKPLGFGAWGRTSVSLCPFGLEKHHKGQTKYQVQTKYTSCQVRFNAPDVNFARLFYWGRFHADLCGHRWGATYPRTYFVLPSSSLRGVFSNEIAKSRLFTSSQDFGIGKWPRSLAPRHLESLGATRNHVWMGEGGWRGVRGRSNFDTHPLIHTIHTRNQGITRL